MIYIATSMYWEASPLIEALKLKKDMDHHKFQIFKNHGVVLIITGIGKLKAAIGLGYLLSNTPIRANDILINIGICGTKRKTCSIGKSYLCNKIVDHDTKRTYYPDMLIKSPFQEASLETYSNIISLEPIDMVSELIDMEASGIFEAGSYFLQPHQLAFIKIVSDHLEDNMIDQDNVVDLIHSNTDEIISWIYSIKDLFQEREIFSGEEFKAIEFIGANLKLTRTMVNRLTQYLRYYKLKKGSINGILDDYFMIHCQSKEEGKRYLEEIKGKIL